MDDFDVVEAARLRYAAPSNNDIEIDEDVKVSRSGDGDGAWVRAWVWVEFPEPHIPEEG